MVGAARRAKLRDVRSDATLIRMSGSGRAYHPPRSARAELGELVHEANAPTVRRMALVFVIVCSWLGPTRRTGHHRQGHALRVDVLAEKAGCSVREVERYLAVLRSAGILRCWQPPSSSGLPKGNRSGHCFNLYELTCEQLPPELERELAGFHRSWWPRRGRLAPVAGDAALSDGAAIARALRARAAPS